MKLKEAVQTACKSKPQLRRQARKPSQESLLLVQPLLSFDGVESVFCPKDKTFVHSCDVNDVYDISALHHCMHQPYDQLRPHRQLMACPVRVVLVLWLCSPVPAAMPTISMVGDTSRGGSPPTRRQIVTHDQESIGCIVCKRETGLTKAFHRNQTHAHTLNSFSDHNSGSSLKLKKAVVVNVKMSLILIF